MFEACKEFFLRYPYLFIPAVVLFFLLLFTILDIFEKPLDDKYKKW